MRFGRIEGDVECVLKTAAADDDHDETLQMMPRPGDRFLDGADVRWRRCRNWFGMGMPVTDKMQSPPVHFIDFSLFLTAAGKIQVSRTAIGVAGTGDGGDLHLFLGQAGEELSSGFKRLMVVLLILDVIP